MAQIYRIYINEAVLIITENIPATLKNYQQVEFQSFDFLSFYSKIKDNGITGIHVLLTPNSKRLFMELKKSLLVIKAAGGLVRNEENKYLFIFRRGKWDLPKGKIDEGEKTKKAAVREVEEECGIQIDEVFGKICKTYHIYEQDNQVILKKTTWYKMIAVDQQNLIPQLEEDITEARWLEQGDFYIVKQNTFPLILDVLSFVED
jgi:8-oxo-dGTP pyrophosphatase MutT (NUDIX family)